MSIHDKIREIEQEIARTQKNKSTERHIGHLKARISRLKLSLEQSALNTKSVTQDGFDIKKSGDARICLVGFPSVGKSTLFNFLTESQNKTAEHAFTTVDCIAGQKIYKDSVLQILDLPGIITDASKNKGRGRQVIAVARTCDLILIVVTNPDEIKKIVHELNEMNIRLNQSKKKITIEKTMSGGIQINDTCNNNQEMIFSILKEFKLNNCLVNINDSITDENLIDVITNRSVYINALVVHNKVDNLSIEQLNVLIDQSSLLFNMCSSTKLSNRKNIVAISSEKGWGIDNLLSTIWSILALKRVFTKKKGIFPDLNEPLVLPTNGTVSDLCRKLHKDFIKQFKGCLVWGTSVKFSPQKVGLNHFLHDEDVVQIYIS